MGNTAFIFDLDGVIVDTAKYHYLAWKKLADTLSIPFDEERNEAFKGVSRKRCLDLLLQWGKVEATEKDIERWLVEKNEDYLVYIDKMDRSEILPDVPKVLDFLKERKVPMALGSASKNAVPILKKVGLLSYFDSVVDGNSVTKAKPDPEVFLIAAKNLGATPKDCVVFEDAVAGIEAANAAQMISIGIGKKDVLAAATHNFNNFTEIHLDFLETILNNNKITGTVKGG